MADKGRRGFLKKAAAVGTLTSLSSVMAFEGLLEEEGQDRDDIGSVSGGIEILDGVNDDEFQNWINDAEKYHGAYEEHKDIFEEISNELEDSRYTVDFEDYDSTRKQGGRGVMVTDEVVMATTELPRFDREVKEDSKWFMSPEHLDAASVGFPTLEEFVEDAPETVELNSLKTYLNDFGQVAPFVSETKYQQPNFSEEIIQEFASQRDELDRHIGKYQSFLNGGQIDLGDRIIETDGLGEVIQDTIDLKNYIEDVPTREISKDGYKDKHVKLAESEALLEGEDGYASIGGTLDGADELYIDAARELGALAVLSEVYDIAVQEMREGAEIYDGGDYNREGLPEDREQPEAPEDDNRGHDGDDGHHETPEDDPSNQEPTRPVYRPECAKLTQWDAHRMRQSLSEEHEEEMVRPLLENIYGRDVDRAETIYSDAGDTIETIYLHYEEREAGGNVRNAQAGYRIINEESDIVPGERESRSDSPVFGLPVYGPYELDSDVVEDVLDFGEEIGCREY